MNASTCGILQAVTAKELREYFAKMGRRGGKASRNSVTAEERKAQARKAAQARWAKKKRADG